ncbi:Deoxyhypusine hydroxylase [Phytophthora cinnamomi]|uniref:Deoxyhypusine hydroxylase n=1 Tax=Phytophthora cinnamomi TaxID=4785 RepID=UPI00355ABE61|nr:Deoxyhypusine hydroxylase [Phytophthora cinnamomi]
MLVCAGRAAQRRALLKNETCSSSSSDEDDGVPHGAIARPRSRFDPRVVRSRNCVNAKKAQRAAVRRRSERARDEERRRRVEEWERALMLARASRVVARHNAEAGALRLVSTYHKMLQHGYLAMNIGDPHTIEIQDFMLSAMAEDIITPDFIGLKTFMQQWDFLSRFHSEVDFRAERLQLFPMEGAAKTYPSLAARDRDEAVYVVKSTGVTTLRISRLTIANIFPHILNDEQLVQHLIGKTYSFSFTTFSHCCMTAMLLPL